MKRPKSELQSLPGIGPAMEKDFHDMGIYTLEDLKKQDPEELYERICKLTGTRQDPCVLYTYRCAVYVARTNTQDPEKRKWWNYMHP